MRSYRSIALREVNPTYGVLFFFMSLLSGRGNVPLLFEALLQFLCVCLTMGVYIYIICI